MNRSTRFSRSLQLLFATFCVVGILCITCSAANPVIKITPEKFKVGVTKSLHVECTFNKGNAQTFTNLYSLLMLHAKENSGDQFAHLVSVKTDGRILNGPPDFHNTFTASGAINGNGVSYINITWLSPKQDRAGVYKCEAHGANSIGRPESLSSTANAEAIPLNLHMLLAKINNMKEELGDLQLNLSKSESYHNDQMRSFLTITTNLQQQINNSKNNCSVEIGILKSLVTLLPNRITDLESRTRVNSNEQRTTKNSLENAKQSMFISSSMVTFNGRRRYWLTRYSSFFNPGYAQSTCQLYGGYLTELDTHEEYSFVRNFISSYGSSNSAVMLGGTDEGHEGHWINRHSKTQVASFWQRGQPDNYRKDEHCSCLWKEYKYAMNDCPCHHVAKDVGFLCEIPE